MKLRVIRGIVVFAGAFLLHGCAAPQPSQDLLAPTEAQMKIRSVQTRTFDMKDRQVAMRAVIAALQDLGFIIERAKSLGAFHMGEINLRGVLGDHHAGLSGASFRGLAPVRGHQCLRGNLFAIEQAESGDGLAPASTRGGNTGGWRFGQCFRKLGQATVSPEITKIDCFVFI